MTNDDDLRTALTKLADEWESRVNQSRLWWDGAGELRALLAAHPAPECECVTSGPDYEGPSETCPQHGRSYSEWVERGDILQARLEALTAPAPVSVEEAWREGEAAGWGRAMRRMSDEPGVRRAKNPYQPTPEGDAR